MGDNLDTAPNVSTRSIDDDEGADLVFGTADDVRGALVNIQDVAGMGDEPEPRAPHNEALDDILPPADEAEFFFGTGAWAGVDTGLEQIDLWMGGLAERPAPFGGMLGSTFNFIFETQLEDLQNADRFYYLERLDGLNLLGTARGQLVRRARDAQHHGRGAPTAWIFNRPGFVFNIRLPGNHG